jgi:hypothetical protein
MNILSTVPPIALLVAGLIVCFFGYRLLRVTLGLAGFGVGLALGLAIGGLVPQASQALTIAVAIVCGILGALAAALLYKLGVFLLGAVAGALAAGILVVATGWPYPLLIRIGGAIVGGILTLLIERPLVSILSAFAGGWAVVYGTFQLLGWRHDVFGGKVSVSYVITVACWLVLALVGAGVQLQSGRRRRDKQRPSPRPS